MPIVTLEQLMDFASKADARLDALEANADKSQALDLTANGWTNDSGSTKYPYQYKLTVEGVTEASRADAVLDEAGEDAAYDCGLCAECETAANAVIFKCRTAPTAAVTGILYIKRNAVLTATT